MFPNQAYSFLLAPGGAASFCSDGLKPIATKDIADHGTMLTEMPIFPAPNKNNVSNSCLFFTAKSKKVCSFEKNYTL
ncbi:hypothetical protein [Flavobacterium polysaccharolyticum]|uniref:Uncharacterized protein n=1 Tax=Flavobacterium polysaccharolyticum TaxID=3133148 RepID=A0ABU9NSL2_9FLAO